MKHVVLIGLLAAGVGACQSSKGSFEDPKADQALHSVLACTVQRAREVAKQPGDPLSLAYAVQGLCASHYSDMRDVGVPARTIRSVEEAASKRAAAEIVKARAGRN